MVYLEILIMVILKTLQVFDLLFLNLVGQKMFQLEENILFSLNRSEQIIIETKLFFLCSFFIQNCTIYFTQIPCKHVRIDSSIAKLHAKHFDPRNLNSFVMKDYFK